MGEQHLAYTQISYLGVVDFVELAESPHTVTSARMMLWNAKLFNQPILS